MQIGQVLQDELFVCVCVCVFSLFLCCFFGCSVLFVEVCGFSCFVVVSTVRHDSQIIQMIFRLG